MAVTLDYLQSSTTGDNLTTYTFSSVNLGTADAERYIITTICARSTDGGARTISSVTINGVSATINSQVTYSGNITAIVSAKVPTGSSGDIVVVFSSGMGNCGIGTYRALNIHSTSAYDTATASNADPISGSIDIEAGGICIAISKTDNTAPQCAWTGVTEDFDETDGGGNCMSGASDLFSTAQSALSISCDFTANTRTCLAVASFSEKKLLTDDCLAYWTLDNKLTDETGNGNTLINTNATYTASGKVNGAYDFNGSSAYMVAPTSLVNSWTSDSEFTFNMWIKYDVTSRLDVINLFAAAATANTYVPIGVIIGLSFGSMRVFSQKYGVLNTYQIDTAASTFTTGTWYMITVCQDASGYYLYKDGVLIGTDTTKGVTGDTTGFDGEFRISSGNAFKYNGVFDEFGIWNRRLSPTEISTLYYSNYGLQYPFTSLLTDNCVAYYTLDNVLTDATGNGNTLTNNGATYTSSGKINGCYSYATNDYMTVPNFLSGLTFVSMAGWIYATNTGGTEPIFATWTPSHYQVYFMIVSNNIYIYLSDGSTYPVANASFSAYANTWTHVAFTYDGTTIRLYINGSEVDTTPTTITLKTDTTVHRIGSDATSYFNGKIDEWGVWDRALSSTEISELYNSGDGFQYPFSAGWSLLINFRTASKINFRAVANISKVNNLE